MSRMPHGFAHNVCTQNQIGSMLPIESDAHRQINAISRPNRRSRSFVKMGSAHRRRFCISRPLPWCQNVEVSFREDISCAHCDVASSSWPHGEAPPPFSFGHGRRRFGVRSADRGELAAPRTARAGSIGIQLRKRSRIPTSATAPSRAGASLESTSGRPFYGRGAWLEAALRVEVGRRIPRRRPRANGAIPAPTTGAEATSCLSRPFGCRD